MLRTGGVLRLQSTSLRYVFMDFIENPSYLLWNFRLMPATGYRLRVVVKDCENKSSTLIVELQAYACHCRDDACTLGEHSRMSVLFQSSTSLLSEGSGVYLREGGE